MPNIDKPTVTNVEGRIAIIFDGNAWFIRSIAGSTHDLTNDEMIYHCDKPLGGPYKTLQDLIYHLQPRARS